MTVCVCVCVCACVADLEGGSSLSDDSPGLLEGSRSLLANCLHLLTVPVSVGGCRYVSLDVCILAIKTASN